MQDDVELVKAALEAARYALPAKPTHGDVLDAYARAAMAATLELAAEAIDQKDWGTLDDNGTAAEVADWLQQRANEVKGSGNG